MQIYETSYQNTKIYIINANVSKTLSKQTDKLLKYII